MKKQKEKLPIIFENVSPIIIKDKYEVTASEIIEAKVDFTELIEALGQRKSRGTFDDFFDTSKYATMQEAYDANDYVECNFVTDKNGINFIEAKHVQRPEDKKLHRLNFQNPVFGLDVLDDNAVCEMAYLLF